MSGDKAVAWLREQVQARLDKARTAELRGPAPWTHEPSAEGRLPVGEDLFDSKGTAVAIVRGNYLAEHITLNDPQDVIARCEAGLAVLAGIEMMEPEVGDYLLPRLASGYKHRPGYGEHWGDASAG